MITKMCPKHKCFAPLGKCPEYNFDEVSGKRVACNSDLEEVSAIFWCQQCCVPSFYDVCPKCGLKLEYICTDIRPVFPEEKLLLAIMLKKEPQFFQDKSVWCSANTYIVNGEKVKLSIGQFNSLPLDEIKAIKDTYDNNKGIIKYEKSRTIKEITPYINPIYNLCFLKCNFLS